MLPTPGLFWVKVWLPDPVSPAAVPYSCRATATGSHQVDWMLPAIAATDERAAMCELPR